MSLIRINVPGQPIRYLELGPARGRISSSPYLSMGGPINDVKPQPSQEKRVFRMVVEREAKAIEDEIEESIRRNEGCGYLMPVLQERCARRRHGSSDHRSSASIAHDRLRRKSA